jgi:hypothetical protein
MRVSSMMCALVTAPKGRLGKLKESHGAIARASWSFSSCGTLPTKVGCSDRLVRKGMGRLMLGQVGCPSNDATLAKYTDHDCCRCWVSIVQASAMRAGM